MIREQLIKLLGGYPRKCTNAIHVQLLESEIELDKDAMIEDADYIRVSREVAKNELLEKIRPYIVCNVRHYRTGSVVEAKAVLVTEGLLND